MGGLRRLRASPMKRVLVTGANGQDGRLLLRAASAAGDQVVASARTEDLAESQLSGVQAFAMDLSAPGQMSERIGALCAEGPLDEVYHFGGLSSPRVCEANPTLAHVVNVLATRELLESCQVHCPQARVLLASSCHVFGKPKLSPQNEDCPHRPDSVYGRNKAEVHQLAARARDRGQWVAVGILYNHESALRSDEFVGGKIAQGVTRIVRHGGGELRLGNLLGRRDWSHAEDFIRAFRLILAQGMARDYVIASGVARTVEEFALCAFAAVELDGKKFLRGERLAESGLPLVGNPARVAALGWNPQFSFSDMVEALVKGVQR